MWLTEDGRTAVLYLFITFLRAHAQVSKRGHTAVKMLSWMPRRHASMWIFWLAIILVSVCVRERRQTTDLEAATRLAMRLTDARRRSKLCWGRSRGKEGEGWGRGEHRGSGTNPFNWPSQDLLHGITLLLAERWNVPFDCNKAAIIVSWGCWWGSTSQVHQKQWR